MPVFFITEMIGLALGMKQKDLGVDRHFIATEEVMCKLEEYEQEQIQKMMNEGGEA
jgi:heterodisulfide reductase subunit B